MEDSKTSKPDLDSQLLKSIDTHLLYINIRVDEIRDLVKDQDWKWSIAAFIFSTAALIATLIH